MIDNGFEDPARIADSLFAVTARIKAESLEATNMATAFHYSSGDLPYLITNRHALEGAERLTIWFAARDTGTGARIPGGVVEKVLEGGELIWYKHPNDAVDVAAVHMADALADLDSAHTPIFRAWLTDEQSTSPADWAELDAIETVHFVGYPDGLYDDHNNLPIIRRGQSATHLQSDYKNLPAFLIDGSVFPGSSGSPVFIFDRGAIAKRGQAVWFGTDFNLIGVVAKEHERTRNFDLPAGSPLAVEINEALDLGLVFKSFTIEETIAAGELG